MADWASEHTIFSDLRPIDEVERRATELQSVENTLF